MSHLRRYLVLAVVAAGCQGVHRIASVDGGRQDLGGNGGGGAGGADDASAPDAMPDIVGTPWDGGGMRCGEATVPIPYTPTTSDVLIAFDHSGSMMMPFGTGTRLTTEQAIIRDVVMTYQDRVRFGYLEFPLNTSKAKCPGGAMCCSGPVVVKPDFMDYPSIDTAMSPCMGGPAPCGEVRINTPTADALRVAREFYEGYADGVTERYVLLSTDGEPNCSSGDPCGAAADQIEMLLADGVKTIVLGVSEEVATSACLDMLGASGGAPKPMGPPTYYAGKDPDSLKKFIADIIGGIAKPSCSIDLKSPPPDATKVQVLFDGVEVPWDPVHMDGWDWADASHTKIDISGAHCTSLESFTVKLIDVRFGCPPCGGTVSCS